MSIEYIEDFENPENTKIVPYSELSDERIVELAKRGDEAAIQEVVAREMRRQEKN